MSSEEILRWRLGVGWAGGLRGCRGRAKIKIFFSSALAVVVCLALWCVVGSGREAVGASSERCCCWSLLAGHKPAANSVVLGHTALPTAPLSLCPANPVRLAKFGGCATVWSDWPDRPRGPTIKFVRACRQVWRSRPPLCRCCCLAPSATVRQVARVHHSLGFGLDQSCVCGAMHW